MGMSAVLCNKDMRHGFYIREDNRGGGYEEEWVAMERSGMLGMEKYIDLGGGGVK